MIKYAEEVVKEINERGTIKIPDNCATGEEFEKWLYEEKVKMMFYKDNMFKKNKFYEFVHKHKKLERFYEKRSNKYRNYIIQKACNCITSSLFK